MGKGVFNTNRGNTDAYLRTDPEGRAEYHEYMSKLAPNDSSDSQRAYHAERARVHRASIKGHAEATARTQQELERRLNARDRKRK